VLLEVLVQDKLEQIRFCSHRFDLFQGFFSIAYCLYLLFEIVIEIRIPYKVVKYIVYFIEDSFRNLVSKQRFATYHLAS